jgi:UPF0755 protein
MRIYQRHGVKIITVVIVFIALSLMVFCSRVYQSIYIKPLQTSKLITLPANSSIHVLVQSKLVSYPKTFILLARLFQWSKHLKQGTYQIKSGETLIDLIHKIEKGEVYTIDFRIIEGTRLCDITHQLQDAKALRFDPKMLQELQSNYPSLEGLLFPSTYAHPYGASILPVLELAYKMMQEHMLEAWNSRDFNLPYHSPYELLIAASIIEKEASLQAERKLISGVIVNRLRLHMPLQMDPTVAYAFPNCQHMILKGQDLKIDSAYNTYRHQGLPPTPICMVSLSSLQAAAHPQVSDYLYFVANGKGGHVFSSQYQQHLGAVKQYIKDIHEH